MAAITVRRFDYDTLKAELSRDDIIAIVSCDCCARMSDEPGGRESMEGLSRKLEADGFRVVCRELSSETCSAEDLAKCLSSGGEEGSGSPNVLIPLACEAGGEAAGQAASGIPVMRIVKTIGAGEVVPGKCLRLIEPDADRDADPKKGITIEEAARRLGLFPRRF